MAKSKSGPLMPDVSDDSETYLPSLATEVAQAADQSSPVVMMRTVEVPLCELTGKGYMSNRFDVTLSPQYATRWNQIVAGLRASNAKARDGRPVFTNADAIRWIIEKTLSEDSEFGKL